MHGGNGFRRVADQAIAALTVVVLALFAAMVTLVFVQIVDRFVPAFSWFWTEELVRALLVWSVMLGLPVVLYRHAEIVIDVLPLRGRLQRWRLALAALCSAVFLVLLAWHGLAFTQRSGGFPSPTLGIARTWLYAPIPLGAALGAIALLIRPRPEEIGT
ncbi:TRAP transporter small permease [Loktanella salsilacus]|uniref:TRAP transporter small permease n=1 Tax=Loktanella salsilacus TaxID=195913 RepID=UPI0037353DDE